MANHMFCDGVARRDFLKVGALAGAGFSLADYMALAHAGELKDNAKGKAAIFVRLAGGPSHMDTFDLKPNAPDTHRGEFKEIKTNVPGVRFSEHLPKLAKCADKFAILRGVSHTLAAHALGTTYLATGNRPLPSIQFPSYGSVVSKLKEAPKDIPPYVSIPRDINNTTGFLGLEYGPFETGGSPRANRRMDVRGLTLRGITLEDVERRQNMLQRYDNAFASLGSSDQTVAGMDKFSQRAYDMIRSNRTRDAFDLTKESAAITRNFDDQSFSQSCLLATRLVEAGSKFVTIQLGGWDTHNDNWNRLKTRNLPALDAGLAGLFNTLEDKGLLGSTTVFVTGEFGRTPKINQRTGRDHYPRAMFCLLAGGGIQGGQVVGESDAKGEGPKDRKITPDDVAATFYHTLGINHRQEFHTPTGRPVMITRYGNVIRELV
ncbi:MAG: hypothetical protein CMO80_01510 [Verrucomicrobiales bacterium]|nr:hypothetical protein [Verrucomicrobiales bacterium]|tara:strand:+ start:4878 stop:6173 length:1296 start_codon:yes stop_codon:yes gene_type:complete